MRPLPTLALAALVALAAAGCDDADARAPADSPSADSAPAAAPAVDEGAAGGRAAGAPARPAQARAASIDLGFTLGETDAPIAVVEFSDFGCPYCARFARATLPTIGQEYIDPGAVRWRYVPVVFGFPGGELMGSAAVCAAELGGDEVFWRVHDLFYARQQALRDDGARPRLLDWVAELGVDRAALDACMDAPGTAETLRVHTETAREWYVRGTPTFLVNGVPMAGAAPVDFFRKVFATVQDPSGL
ncbi:MAG: thioredoxin domain-containing protein [Longimicrobiales bacterium]